MSMNIRLFILLFAILHSFGYVINHSVAQDRGMRPVKIKIQGTLTDLYDESHALVIGVSKYSNGWPRLPGVKEDIRQVKQALEANGFNVVLIEDPDDKKLEDAFENFIDTYALKPNNRVLFYFAGHGHTQKVADGREMGYIVPANAPLPENNLSEFHTKAISMRKMETYAREILSKHALFLFDACFSGKLFNLSRAVPYSISYKTTNPVRQFITSGSAEEEVPDQSWFRRYFIIALTSDEADGNGDDCLTASELSEFLFEKVTNYSYDNQHPQYGKIRDSHLDKGDFVFVLNPINFTRPTITPTAGKERKAIRYGDLEITSHISGYLYIDGNKVVQVYAGRPRPIYDLAEGPHTITIKGKETITKTMTFVPGQSDKITIGSPPKPTAYPINEKKEESASWFPKEVFIEGGLFQMGCNKWDAAEKPVHTVSVNDFYMGKYEVTQKQWRAIMGRNHGELRFKGCDQCPVENVSWGEIHDFLKKLSTKMGKTYRLPTEAEWEYAARGGKQSQGYNTYSGSNTLEEVAWYSENSDLKTHPVGQKKPNELGLYDMIGNVAEWCSDRYSSDYYQRSPPENPRGPLSGDYRVLRGGSWSDLPRFTRTTCRKGGMPTKRNFSYGFRVCRSK